MRRGFVNSYGWDFRSELRPNASVAIGGSNQPLTSNAYYPYGLPMGTSTGATENRYRYGGKEWEATNGLNLYDFEARFHDPSVGFLSPDPMYGQSEGAPYGIAPRVYCAANPLRYTDPTGMFKVSDDTLQKYPWFQAIIKYLIPFTLNNERTLYALRNNSYMLSEDIKDDFTYNSGPEINVDYVNSREFFIKTFPNEEFEELHVCGLTVYTVLKKTGEVINKKLYINQSILDSFDTSLANCDFLTAIHELGKMVITIQHEYCHYANPNIDESDKREYGYAFENEAYGEDKNKYSKVAMQILLDYILNFLSNNN